jgi:hypothetical protein
LGSGTIVAADRFGEKIRSNYIPNQMPALGVFQSDLPINWTGSTLLAAKIGEDVTPFPEETCLHKI